MTNTEKKITNEFKTYCIIQPNTKNGFCITSLNINKYKYGKSLLIAKIMGLGPDDIDKFKTIMNNLSKSSIYKARLGLESVDLDQIKLLSLNEKERKYLSNKNIEFKLQLIGKILKIEDINMLKQLVKSEYLDIKVDKEDLDKITDLWWKPEIKKGGTSFRKLKPLYHSKNIRSIYMKHTRKNRRQRGGFLNFLTSWFKKPEQQPLPTQPAQPMPNAQQPAPVEQPPVTVPPAITGGRHKRTNKRKLKQHKSRRHH
jgi:hypothetical protein